MKKSWSPEAYSRQPKFSDNAKDVGRDQTGKKLHPIIGPHKLTIAGKT